jgi:hypothetical protein
MKLAFSVLAFWLAASSAMADEIRDLFTQQQVRKVAAERATARAARRKGRRPTKAESPKRGEPLTGNRITPNGHGITEIGSEFGFGFHTSTVYTLILKSDGTFRFEGHDKTDHMGKWTGKIDPQAFDELAKFIRDAGYMDMKDIYPFDATDLTPLYTTVVQDGKRHVIEDWGTGPEKLKAIERRIYALLDGATWNEQPATSD